MLTISYHPYRSLMKLLSLRAKVVVLSLRHGVQYDKNWHGVYLLESNKYWGVDFEVERQNDILAKVSGAAL